MESRDNKEDFGIKELRHFKNSIIYSLAGLKTAYKEERSLWLHLALTAVVVVLAIIFKISVYDWILSITILSMVLAIELLNTSIEACVDLVTTKHHPLAKKAKDIASSSAFMVSIFGGICELMIFIPYFIEYFK